MPLVPLIVVAAAMLAVATWRRALTGPTWARAALPIAIALLLVDPVLSLERYERTALAEGGNLPYFDLADRIRAERRPGERVVLDSDLGGTRVASGRQGVNVLEYLLVVSPDPVPAVTGRVDDISEWIAAGSKDDLLVLLPFARQKLQSRHRLTSIPGASVARGHRLDDVRLFRVREAFRPPG